MNKTELVALVAEKSGLTKKDAEAALTATLDAVIEAVTNGDKVQLVGFGTFEQRQRNARTGCDPRTGKSIDIPASKVPAFKAGKAFKEAVNK
ncbi:MAG: HU family DNA-binding protein [Oscillospiraceae bacterium]|nr:HU family DNA-binding protein [Oscillospiraceae bacterium]